MISDNIQFVGRDKEMDEIVSMLDYGTSKSTRIVNVYGSPGFGKSTLVIHVGHRMLANGVNVHYVNLVDCPKESV